MGDAAMELTPEQLNELADMVATRVRAERPEIERTASGQLAIETPARPMVVLPPEFWELQAEFRAEVREGRARFEAMEKRFEAVDKRFEAVDTSGLRISSTTWTSALPVCSGESA